MQRHRAHARAIGRIQIPSHANLGSLCGGREFAKWQWPRQPDSVVPEKVMDGNSHGIPHHFLFPLFVE